MEGHDPNLAHSVPPPSMRGPVAPSALVRPGTGVLPSMVIGAAGMLLGGTALLLTAYDIGDRFRGPLAGSGYQEALALVLGAAIALLGGVTFVRGLVVREDLRHGADAASIALVTFVTVPLAMLALGGWAYTHQPDRQLRAKGVPYTFAYPGEWRRATFPGVEEAWNAGYVIGIGNPAVGRPDTHGVMVAAFVPKSRAALIEWVRTPGPRGPHVMNERYTEIAGHRAFGVDYRLTPAIPYQSQFAFMHGEVAFVITCFTVTLADDALEVCKQVRETFRFWPGYRGDVP